VSERSGGRAPGPRVAERSRRTRETSIDVRLDLDGTGTAEVSSGLPFFDHMLDQLGRHGCLGLSAHAKGDLEVDAHHTVEDVGFVLGQALSDALDDRRGIRRYGDALVPMDEALVQVALDLSGRALLAYDVAMPPSRLGTYDTSLTPEFLRALCRGAGLTLHVRLLAGSDPHHCTEAVFKAVARALFEAVSRDARGPGEVPSTKGVL
jgi:imidazoleglycerol-phosphate dehydratase